MPNRILKESICTSDTIDQLKWDEEVFFYRLIVNCDDYGRFDGRPAIIKSRLYPLKMNITLANIEKYLDKLSTVGLVVRYISNGKPTLQLTTWDKHQQVRAKKSKYPAPEDGEIMQSDNVCNQLISNDCKCPRNPIQSESNPNPNPNTEDNAHTCANSSPVKHKYGEYNNVLLSDEDLEKLKSEFPGDYQQRIERLSAYIASKGAKYKNHLATIRNWAKREEQAKKDAGTFGGTPPSYDLEELAKRGMYVPEI